MRKHVTVVGSGPNGLMAAIILSNSGYKVTIIESHSSLGGGLRSFKNEEYGTIHDKCSAVHPMAVLSPAFRSIKLHQSVEMIYPPVPFAHAFSRSDSDLLNPLQKRVSKFCGVAAHGMTDPFSPIGLGVGIALYSASKTVGWPIPKGGSQKILDYLISQIDFSNVRIKLNTYIHQDNFSNYIDDASVVIWDTIPDIPKDIIGITNKKTKYLSGATKADFVLSSPVPWDDINLTRAGTVHLGGTYKNIRNSELSIQKQKMTKEPFVILSQPSIFDSTRAPEGLYTLWAYAHVPNGTHVDAVELCTDIIEKYAPGFASTILSAISTDSEQLEVYNPNYKGGDILSGSTVGWQMFPQGIRHLPWTLPRKGWFICSSSIFPGPGVHGLGGMFAAKAAMQYF